MAINSKYHKKGDKAISKLQVNLLRKVNMSAAWLIATTPQVKR